MLFMSSCEWLISQHVSGNTCDSETLNCSLFTGYAIRELSVPIHLTEPVAISVLVIHTQANPFLLILSLHPSFAHIAYQQILFLMYISVKGLHFQTSFLMSVYKN
jgi:hypothetical protein